MTKKIAIIGSRGIPAKYGGFETFTEKLSVRLVKRGYDIYVSCEEGEITKYGGVKLLYFPTRPFNRMVYEILYDMYFLVRTIRFCDCVYVLGIGSAPLFFISKLYRKKIIVNPDGLEWKRNKFKRWQKAILYFEWLCAITFADIIVADSVSIKDHINQLRKKDVYFIAYGVDVPKIRSWDVTELNTIIKDDNRLVNLKTNSYYLIIARLEPENNIHLMVEGFLKSNTNKKLIIVGSFQNDRYKTDVTNIINNYNGQDRIIFTGSIYKLNLLNMLRQNCFAYMHGHSVGGTNPSLLEMMITKAIIIAYDNEFNREVGDQSLLYFKFGQDLSNIINKLEENVNEYVHLKNDAYIRVKDRYSWDKIVQAYSKLFDKIFTTKK